MQKFELTDEEVGQVRSVLAELVGRYPSSEDPAFLDESAVWAHELPRRLRGALTGFRLREPDSGLLLVSGYPVDGAKIGATPKHWRDRVNPAPTLEEELYLVLLGSLLGDVIGWSTQQAGYVVHDILPIPGHEHEQLGSGSEELLTWHIEDAFHPCRGDYIGLMCLRNPYQVATTVGFLNGEGLAPEVQSVLCQPRFTIRPDESHLPKNRAADAVLTPALERAYRKIEQMNTAPEKIPVLFGDPSSPYLRLDPYFMDPLDDDPEAQRALDALVALLDRRMMDMVLQAGDVILIDNFKAVHGRKPFKARYDGTDRWLKRVNITRDLRKSRELRETSASRVVC